MNLNPVSEGNRRGRRLGLAGGMGCGKSTVAGIFRELGFGVLESDVLVRELWEQEAEVQQAAVARWGGRILEPVAASGKRGVASSTSHTSPSPLSAPDSPLTISRRRVADIVFADPAELDWLENLLHPRVRARWQAALAAEPQKDWVVEIPLLFEKSLASGFDFTLCIASSPELQAARLAKRGLTPAEVAARQARQWPLRDKIERANWVALNDGSLDFLRHQIVLLAARLRESNP